MPQKKLIATVAFLVVVGGVLALFIAVLPGIDTPPPKMSSSKPHLLRFNLNGDLVGVETDPPFDPLLASVQKWHVQAVGERLPGSPTDLTPGQDTEVDLAKLRKLLKTGALQPSTDLAGPAGQPLQPIGSWPFLVPPVERINASCIQCHAECTSSAASVGPCRVEHHPPKLECIKCHRMAPSGAASDGGPRSGW